MAASLMMKLETGWHLFGYPAIAFTLMLIGVALGLGIILSALIFDRRARSKEERGHR